MRIDSSAAQDPFLQIVGNSFFYQDPGDPTGGFLIDCGHGLIEDNGSGSAPRPSDELVEQLEMFWPLVRAVIISHGHLDHCNLLNCKPGGIPVFCSPVVERFLRFEAGFDSGLGQVLKDLEVQPIECVPRPITPVGATEVQGFWVPHSVPETMGFRFRLAGTTIVHMPEFKFQAYELLDQPRLARHLARLGAEGVDLLVLDVQNIRTPGFTPSEREVLENLGHLLSRIQGRVALTCFSSNLERVELLVSYASILGRGFQLRGTGLRKAQEALGSRLPLESRIAACPLVFATGCQAESQAALGKDLGWGWRQRIGLRRGDTLIFSSRAIPGNERRVADLIQDFQRRGVRLIVNVGEKERLGLGSLPGIEEELVHASGHASLEDVRLAIKLLHPRYILPRPMEGGNAEALQELVEGTEIRVLTKSVLTLGDLA